jgi:transposase-like protein
MKASREDLNNTMHEIRQAFSNYRKSQILGKSGRIRKYPDSLKDRCHEAVEMGASVLSVASASGISTSCLDRWRSKGKAKQQQAPESPSIEIFKVKEQIKKENPPLILSIQGIRIEIRREDEHDFSTDS